MHTAHNQTAYICSADVPRAKRHPYHSGNVGSCPQSEVSCHSAKAHYSTPSAVPRHSCQYILVSSAAPLATLPVHLACSLRTSYSWPRAEKLTCAHAMSRTRHSSNENRTLPFDGKSNSAHFVFFTLTGHPHTRYMHLQAGMHTLKQIATVKFRCTIELIHANRPRIAHADTPDTAQRAQSIIAAADHT